ncbi:MULTISPECIES: DnaJ family domain-containing protein [Chromobacteriaceae]|uniref:DnaJ homologue subfamily C member 28 conserved domain-containing protein n=1 Tax=Pseudogulbenkiania ferrooxidans EGD-HP2 TaxID=1388764 RepID=A0ABP2XLX4_9NEIS|nr:MULTISPECIES: DnaJ family domain-containing protein [Chromobacteriaceae]ERE07019.1 hypothetical protein O166_07855 [Pseudogulbenkiania ferrooxidans EGD-HP2]MCD4504707.1 DUF1992 domain-containing protein [Chromobacterium piscinae]
MQSPRDLDAAIPAGIRASEQSGERQRAKVWGKPLELNDGYAATPVELRTSYKILKDAGCVPAEVEAIRELAALREELAALEPDTPAWRGKQAKIQ